MAIQCAQCLTSLTPANVHRCNRCGLPYCRKHVRNHTCEHTSREDIAQWANSFEKGADEAKGELPTGATYRPVSGAKLFSPEIASAGLIWLLGLGAVLAGVFSLIPFYVEVLMIAGVVVSLFGSVFLARTFARMHSLSRFAAFMIFLVFAGIPILIVVGIPV